MHDHTARCTTLRQRIEAKQIFARIKRLRGDPTALLGRIALRCETAIVLDGDAASARGREDRFRTLRAREQRPSVRLDVPARALRSTEVQRKRATTALVWDTYGCDTEPREHAGERFVHLRCRDRLHAPFEQHDAPRGFRFDPVA